MRRRRFSSLRAALSRGGNDTRFLMWGSFVGSVATSRLWVLTVGFNAPDLSPEFSIGARIILAGYHLHHIALGMGLLAVAGFIGLHYGKERLPRASAAMWGVGLGFVVDEIGFVVGGITPYEGDGEVLALVGAISLLFLAGAYWRTLHRVAGDVGNLLLHRDPSERLPEPGSIGNEGPPDPLPAPADGDHK